MLFDTKCAVVGNGECVMYKGGGRRRKVKGRKEERWRVKVKGREGAERSCTVGIYNYFSFCNL